MASNEQGSEASRTGGCLCGAVRYAINGEPRPVINCHCAQCRRTTGHYAAFSAARREDFEFVDKRGLAWYESSPGVGRGFCNVCGATLFWDRSTNDYIGVAAGTFDEPTGLTTIGHIFVAFKGDYYALEDDLPKMEEGRGSNWPADG